MKIYVIFVYGERDSDIVASVRRELEEEHGSLAVHFCGGNMFTLQVPQAEGENPLREISKKFPGLLSIH